MSHEEKPRENTKQSTILDILRNLKPGDLIEVWWADANENNVKVTALPLPNYCVETRQLEIGWFVGLQKGDTWGDLHLLFETRMTDPDSVSVSKHRISSIPLARKCIHCGEYTLTLVHQLVSN